MKRQCGIHHRLGIGPGNQGRGVQDEGKTPKLPLAEDAGDGLTREAPLHCLAEPLGALLAQSLRAGKDELGLSDA